MPWVPRLHACRLGATRQKGNASASRNPAHRMARHAQYRRIPTVGYGALFWLLVAVALILGPVVEAVKGDKS